jgi:hypothetical protein
MRPSVFLMPGMKNLAVVLATGLFALFLQWLPFCERVSALDINEDISTDTVWTVADSPVIINKADFTVPAGKTLAIEPGVTVRVKSSISVYGVLSAVGTSTDRIGFIKHDVDSSWDGIHFDDWEASGEIRNNTLILTGPRSVTGVSTYGADEISGNHITGIITTNYPTAKGYGIYFLASNAGSNDHIFDNTISLSTNQANIYLYCIYTQCGKIRNNRITATHSGASGKVYGITTDYYQIFIENNSILLSAAGANEYGIAFSTHYNESKTSVLKNNIIQGSAAATSIGVYKSAGYVASVMNSYNTVYNFTDAYEGLTADPEFADASLHLSRVLPP